jgi:anti-sigma B factor antagonist
VKVEGGRGTDKDAHVVSVAGEVDVCAAPAFRSAIAAAVEGDCSLVVVDLCGATLIDSAGLGVLVGALRRVRDSGRELRVACDQEDVIRVFLAAR